MRFLVYLMMLLFVGTAIAQNPTILQGNYITNVFGNSNFVLNPNAQTNVANVTNATRSTTTPLVATSEFTLSLASGANATWTLRAFDSGMKGQNCEARFTYRGFATATTKAEIVQNSLVVATLTLTPSTDPRIASINFPCGDLVNATTFRIAQTTANMTGTNEIGGIYVGLATNMANVAQAEFVGSLNFGSDCTFQTTSNTYGTPTDASCTTTPTGNVAAISGVKSGITINDTRPGTYRIVFYTSQGIYNSNDCRFQVTDGTTVKPLTWQYQTATTTMVTPVTHEIFYQYTASGTRTIEFQLRSNNNTNLCEFSSAGVVNQYIYIYRFPSSSELVVTPERQAWYISGNHAGADAALGTSAVTTTTEITNGSLTFTPDSGSQPVATLCSSTNAPPSLSTSATTCSAGNEAIGITYNIPSVGLYEVCAQFTQALSLAANGQVDAYFSIQETATNANTALTSYKAINTNAKAPSSALDINFPVNVCSTINYTSVGQKAVRLMYRQGVNGTITTNVTSNSYNDRATYWTVRPVTNQSNSALYVQGPVLASQTGAAIPSGYVGEVKHSATTPGCGTASQYNDGASVSLTPGIWQVTSQAVLGLTAAATVNNWIVFTGPTTGNSSTWRSNDLNDYSIAGVSIASVPGITQPLLVKYDGTNLFYFANGSYTGSTASASGTIYAKYFRNHSGTCSTVTSSITAIRLN